MTVDDLVPRPAGNAPFRLDQTRTVPHQPGCYVLATSQQVILYVGLSRSLRTRMAQHLENPHKTQPTPLGRARLFYWLACANTEQVERTWMNEHLCAEGKLPILNGAYSPVSI